MTERVKIDWAEIEAEYRTGQFSNCALASKYGISETAIRKKVKKENWTKDLAKLVREKVRDKLVRAEVREHSREDDEKAIEKAVAVGVKIIKGHRKDIQKLRTLEQVILNELAKKPKKLYITQYQGKIVQKELGLTVSEKAAALRDLSNVQHKRITLERQAFNLDERDGSDEIPDSLTIMFNQINIKAQNGE